MFKTLQGSAGWLLTLLFFVNVMSYLDRQVLAIVQEALAEDLGLHDGQLGWLHLAFGVSLALCAIPIGRLADKVSRQKVLVACLSLWSLATALVGFAAHFAHVLIARIGVGAGEAGVTPTAYALIADKFPLRRRATAMAICGAGVPIGIGLSMMLGGTISEHLNWRWAFILFGVPGFGLAALIALTIIPPKRGQSDGLTKLQSASLSGSIRRLLSSPAFTLALLGSAFKTISSAGLLAWAPSLFIRRYGLSAETVGLTFGALVAVIALIALLGAAYLADRLSERDIRWYSWIVTISQLLALPFVMLALFSSSYVMALIFFAFSILFSNSMLAISNAIVQNTAPIHMRSMASALKSMALTFLGFGLGSFLIGQLSEHVFDTGSDATDLLWAMSVGASFHLLAALIYWLCSFHLKADIERANKDSGLVANIAA